MRKAMNKMDFSDKEMIQKSKKLINANSKAMINWNLIININQTKTISFLIEKVKGSDIIDSELGLFLLNKVITSMKTTMTTYAIKEVISAMITVITDEEDIVCHDETIAMGVIELFQSMCKFGLFEKGRNIDTHDVRQN